LSLLPTFTDFQISPSPFLRFFSLFLPFWPFSALLAFFRPLAFFSPFGLFQPFWPFSALLAFFSPFWPFQQAFTFGLFGLNLGAVFIFKPFIFLISALAWSAIFGSSQPLLAFGLFGLNLGVVFVYNPIVVFSLLLFFGHFSAISNLSRLFLPPFWPLLAFSAISLFDFRLSLICHFWPFSALLAFSANFRPLAFLASTSVLSSFTTLLATFSLFRGHAFSHIRPFNE
jgi:hypothetical protein